MRVNPATGDRTVLSGCAVFDFETSSCTVPIGIGPLLDFPEDIAVEADGSLVVANLGGAVVQVNPATGDRTILSEMSNDRIGTGPLLDFPGGIAVEADSSLVVADLGAGAIVRVNPVTGDRISVSRIDRGNGPLFVSPEYIAVEADGSLIVVDTTLGAVLRVDPFTGDRTLISR